MQEEKGINKTTFMLMIMTALLFDGIQFLLTLIIGIGWLLSPAVGIFAFLTFYVWFKLHGVSFMRPKRATAMVGGIFIEIMPILNALPAWTLAVILIALDSKVKKVIPTSAPGATSSTPLRNK